MVTPLYRQAQGSILTVAAASMPSSTLTNNSFTSSAVCRLQSTTYSGALLFDVRLSGSFGTDPAGVGSLQLIIVMRSFDGVQGPTPSSTILGKSYPFTPTPTSTSAKVYGIDSISLPMDCDLWLLNYATGQTFTYTNTLQSSAAAFSIQAWTPGT